MVNASLAWAAISSVLMLLALPVPCAAQVTGGSAPTTPCIQDAASGALACQAGSSVGTDGVAGTGIAGGTGGAAGAGFAANNTAIGVDSTSSAGGNGGDADAAGTGGVGGIGGTGNLAFGADSAAGNAGNGGSGGANGFGGSGGAGGDGNIALGNGSHAGNGGDGGSGCCGSTGAAGRQGTDNNVAIGQGASASGGGSVVLGFSNVVSVGSATLQRRITNVAAGTAATDAVHLAQLSAMGTSLNSNLGSVATWLGGGASYSAGAIVAPAYSIQGTLLRGNKLYIVAAFGGGEKSAGVGFGVDL